MKNVIILLMTASLPTWLVACESTSVQKEYYGKVQFGPERMSFVPCGSTKESWLHHSSIQADGWEEVQEEIDKQPYCDLSTVPCEFQTALIFAEAIMKDKDDIEPERPNRAPYFGDGFGHLGLYDTEITLHEVMLISECPKE